MGLSAHSGIFLRRLVGGATAWPQRTQLSVSIPVASSAEERAPGTHLTVSELDGES